MTTNSKIVLSVLGMAAVGAIVGVLIAPDKGSKIRNRISSKACDIAGEVSDWLTSKQRSLAEVKNSVSSTAENMADDAGKEWKKAKNALS